MLYRLSAMEGTSFRQISDRADRKQVRPGYNSMTRGYKCHTSWTGTVSHVQVLKIVSHMGIHFNVLMVG